MEQNSLKPYMMQVGHDLHFTRIISCRGSSLYNKYLQRI